MPSADPRLPEGTDTIIDGAGPAGEGEFDIGAAEGTGDENDAAALASGFAPEGTGASSGSDSPQSADGETPADLKSALFGRLDDVKGQAGDKARDFVQAGKDRATSALDDLVRMVEEAASQVDDTIGSQYGDYARRAAEGIGTFSDSFKNKDVDQIFDEARELVKKSPGAAVGIAAALGFVVARLVRAGAASDGKTNPAA